MPDSDLIPKWLVDLGTVCSGIGGLAALLYAFFFVRSLSALRWQANLTAFSQMLETLQSQYVRSARHVVFGLEAKPYDQWDDAEKAAVSIACQAFDTVAFIASIEAEQKRDAYEKMLRDLWGHAMVRVWRISATYVREVKRPEYDEYNVLYRYLESFVVDGRGKER